MMKQIRRGVFETNSSSMHSITIADKEGLYDTLAVQDDGTVVLHSGEFGWDEETFTDAATKAAYCWQTVMENEGLLKMLKEVILTQTGAIFVTMLPDNDEYWPYGYIDHKSSGIALDAFKSKETLREFIFNTNSELVIDNDNH